MPKIRKGAGSNEKVIWDQEAQKFGKRSRKQQKIGKWSKRQEKSSGSKRNGRYHINYQPTGKKVKCVQCIVQSPTCISTGGLKVMCQKRGVWPFCYPAIKGIEKNLRSLPQSEEILDHCIPEITA